MPLFRPFAAKSAAPRLPAPPEAKATVSPWLVALSAPDAPRWTSRTYASLAQEGFATNPIGYRCIRMIAEAAASAPLVVFVDGKRADPAHPLQRLIDHPNPDQTAPDLMESFVGALQTSGNAFLEAVGDGPLSELYALRPDRMEVVAAPNGWPAAYLYKLQSQTRRIARQADGWMPALHLKLFNPLDDRYGFSPLQAAGRAVDIHNTSAAWNKALLDNAARPSGALVYANTATGDRMSEEQFDRLKTELEAVHTGANSAGRPMLLEGGLEWKPMSLSPSEMDFIEGKHVAAREIALAFGVPPQLLGIPGDATYNTFKEANIAFWRNTVAPLAERTARALSGWLGPRFPAADGAPAVVAVDLDRVPALAAEREALWARLDAASFLTLEERRRMAGLGVTEDDSRTGPGAVDHD